MRLTVLGCGDAFGSGGRLQTSFHISSESGDFLIDCGATTLISLHRFGLNPDSISKIFITHLHGDHFSGLVWLFIYYIYSSKRKENLLIVGPVGLEDRFIKAAETLFPGSSKSPKDFNFNFVNYENQKPLVFDDISLYPFEVSHPAGGPSYALRLNLNGITISFSGDTEWIDVLKDVAEGSHLFITECFTYSTPVRYHLSWGILKEKIDLLKAHKIMITHMGPEMLMQKKEISLPHIIFAEDGLILDL